MKSKYLIIAMICYNSLFLGIAIYGQTYLPNDFYNCERIPEGYNEGRDYKICTENPEQYYQEYRDWNLILITILWIGMGLLPNIIGVSRIKEERQKELSKQ